MNHSVSAANTMRRCSRLYFYKYIQGWESVHKAPWLEFGTKIDNLLEILDNSNLSNALANIPSRFADPFDQADVEFLLRLWHKQYGADPLPPIPVNYKKGNQVGFKLPFQGNIVTGLVSLNISGYIDKVTLVGNDPAIWEGKTTSENIAPTPSNPYWLKLNMDPQIEGYCWALSQILNRPVNWVWYQAIRSPSVAANACFARTHTVKGVEDVPYSLEQYKARQWAVLEKGPAKPLVHRKRLYVTDERKELWLTEHVQNWQEIQAKKACQRDLEERGLGPELAWPRNPGGCPQFGGCHFWDICTGVTTVEASGKFIKREKYADQSENQLPEIDTPLRLVG
jgi:hypothetical protein